MSKRKFSVCLSAIVTISLLTCLCGCSGGTADPTPTPKTHVHDASCYGPDADLTDKSK